MSQYSEDKIRIVIEGDSKDLNKTLQSVEKQLSGFAGRAARTGSTSGGIGVLNTSLQKMAALAGSAFAVERVADFGREAILLASRLEGIERNFEQITQTGSTSLMELRRATMGAVSDFDLMQKSVQARNFQLPLQNLAQFFEFATIRAQQTGESVDYLVNSIVLGIGRKSPLILDNLGITLVRLKEAMGKVGRESATVEEISQAVAKIAKEETELLKTLGKTAKTTGQEIDTLTASYKNFQTVFGEMFLGSTRESSNWLGDAFQDSADVMKLMNEEGKGFLATWGAAEIAFVQSLLGVSTFGNIAEKALARLEERASKASAEFRVMLGSMFRKELTQGTAESYKDIADKLLIMKSNAQITAEQFDGLGDALLAIAKAKGDLDKILDDASVFEKTTAIVDNLNDKLRESQAIFNVDSDSEAFVKRDIALYTKAMVELEMIGQKSSKTYASYRQEISRLNEEFAKLTLPELSAGELYSKEDIDAAIKKAMAEIRDRATSPTEFEETIGTYGLEDETAPEADIKNIAGMNEELQKMAGMLSAISTAMGQISSLFGDSDSDVAKFISGFSKVISVVAAAAGAMAAFKSFFDGGTSAVKAVAIATGVAGAIAGIASVGASRGASSGGFNLSGGSQPRLYTEISGTNLRILLDRENRFSNRRG